MDGMSQMIWDLVQQHAERLDRLELDVLRSGAKDRGEKCEMSPPQNPPWPTADQLYDAILKTWFARNTDLRFTLNRFCIDEALEKLKAQATVTP